MTLKEIIKAAMQLSQSDKRKLINAIMDDNNKSQSQTTKLGKDEFCSFYKDKFETEYYWVAKDYVALRQLLNKIKKKLKEQNKSTDHEMLVSSISAFYQAVFILNNEWYKQNFSMSILNSHFNTLYANITRNKTAGISNNFRQQILRDLQS